jgi:hypothetical protein
MTASTPPNWWEHLDLKHAATHEAGHAVHATVHGLAVGPVRLGPSADGYPGGRAAVRSASVDNEIRSEDDERDVWLALDSELAGAAAECVAGSPRWEGQMYNEYRRALPYLRRLRPDLSGSPAYEVLIARGEAVTDEMRPYEAAVAAVAKRLLASPREGDRMEISGREALELIRSALELPGRVESAGVMPIADESVEMFVLVPAT